MAKTLTQLTDICIRRTKDDSPDAVKGFKEDLKTAEQIVAAFKDWPELRKTDTLSLEDGTEEYDLASDVDKVYEPVTIITPTNQEKELGKIDQDRLRAMNPVRTNDSEAIPSHWFMADPSISDAQVETKRMGFYPIPDQDYTAEYPYKRIPDMSSDSDYPFFNGKYHHILPEYAIWQYAEREPDSTLNPSYWENSWEKGLSLILETNTGQTKQLTPVPGPDQYRADV